MKHKSRKPTIRELTDSNQAAFIDVPAGAPTQLLQRAVDTMHNLYTLRVQINDAGLKLSPASLIRIQTVADTVLYLFDVENKMPHPLRQVAEINDALSSVTTGKNY